MIKNILYIQGSTETLEKLIKINVLGMKSFSFSYSCPYNCPYNCPYSCPYNFRYNKKKWSLENWSSTRDAFCCNILKFKNRELVISFKTLDNPPENWLRYIHFLYPEIIINLVWTDGKLCGEVSNINSSRIISGITYENNKELINYYFD